MHVVVGGWPIVVTNIPIIYGRAVVTLRVERESNCCYVGD